MSWLHDLADRVPVWWHLLVEVLRDQFSSWTGWVFLAAWAATLIGGYVLGRFDRETARIEKARRARHGRRAAR